MVDKVRSRSVQAPTTQRVTPTPKETSLKELKKKVQSYIQKVRHAVFRAGKPAGFHDRAPSASKKVSQVAQPVVLPHTKASKKTRSSR